MRFKKTGITYVLHVLTTLAMQSAQVVGVTSLTPSAIWVFSGARLGLEIGNVR
jgi:hypothetical protein